MALASSPASTGCPLALADSSVRAGAEGAVRGLGSMVDALRAEEGAVFAAVVFRGAASGGFEPWMAGMDGMDMVVSSF